MQTGRYQHYKGAFYVVMISSPISHSETLENMVLYRHEEDGKFDKLWIRPVSMFIELVKWPDGEMQPRFKKVAERVIKTITLSRSEYDANPRRAAEEASAGNRVIVLNGEGKSGIVFSPCIEMSPTFEDD